MAAAPEVTACHTPDSWTAEFQKGKDSKQLVVVDFTASWCGPCRFIAPILVDLAKQYPHVKFLKVDVDELKVVSEEWRIEAMPTLVFLKEGKEVDRMVGAKKDELLSLVQTHSATASV